MKHGQKPRTKTGKSVRKAVSGKSSKKAGPVKQAKTKAGKSKTGSKAGGKAASKKPAKAAGSKAAVKTSKAARSPVARSSPAKPQAGNGRGAVVARTAAVPVTFSNPTVGSAFRRALKKYAVALKRLND